MTDVQRENRRIAREKRTIGAMIRLYCHGQHGVQAGLCASCKELHDYAIERLTRCPFGGRKPVCAQCPVHCYRRAMRERIVAVMKYAGPRMLLRHPILAMAHLCDERRSRKHPPAKPPTGGSSASRAARGGS